MFHKSENKLKLLARSEGKIKSYDSCFDIRAWSHDTENRVRYLRDWIKCDMPICVLPVSIVAGSLRMMSWRHRGKVCNRYWYCWSLTYLNISAKFEIYF